MIRSSRRDRTHAVPLLDMVFSLGYYVPTSISSLTIDRSRFIDPQASDLRNSLFWNILRVSPYSSKILRVVWL